jgi:hypothetical protein
VEETCAVFADAFLCAVAVSEVPSGSPSLTHVEVASRHSSGRARAPWKRLRASALTPP